MKSLEELRAIKAQMQMKIGIRNDDSAPAHVVVGMATCGIAAGARAVATAFTNEIANAGLNTVAVTLSGCAGMCALEPIVEVTIGDAEKVVYVKMDAEKAARVVKEHIVGGNVVTEYTIAAAK